MADAKGPMTLAMVLAIIELIFVIVILILQPTLPIGWVEATISVRNIGRPGRSFVRRTGLVYK